MYCMWNLTTEGVLGPDAWPRKRPEGIEILNEPTDFFDPMIVRNRAYTPALSHLPTRIRVLGFAVNTLFYAILLTLAADGARRFIQGRRRSRGLCIWCAYDRRSLAPSLLCPECGGPLDSRAAPASDSPAQR